MSPRPEQKNNTVPDPRERGIPPARLLVAGMIPGYCAEHSGPSFRLIIKRRQLHCWRLGSPFSPLTVMLSSDASVKTRQTMIAILLPVASLHRGDHTRHERLPVFPCYCFSF